MDFQVGANFHQNDQNWAGLKLCLLRHASCHINLLYKCKTLNNCILLVNLQNFPKSRFVTYLAKSFLSSHEKIESDMPKHDVKKWPRVASDCIFI